MLAPLVNALSAVSHCPGGHMTFLLARHSHGLFKSLALFGRPYAQQLAERMSGQRFILRIDHWWTRGIVLGRRLRNQLVIWPQPRLSFWARPLT